MKLYQSCYNGKKFETSESVFLRKLEEDLYLYSPGYFSNILVYDECIKEKIDNNNFKLDVIPVGQISRNIVNIFKEDNLSSEDILVNLDAKKLNSKLDVLSSKNKPIVIVHSDTSINIETLEEPNFSNKIYLVEKGEKLYFRVNGKTIFLIDNTKSSPLFINIM